MELKLVVGFSTAKVKSIKYILFLRMYLELHQTTTYCEMLICQILQ